MKRNKIAAIFLTLAFILAGGMLGDTIGKAQAHFTAKASPATNLRTAFWAFSENLTPAALAASIGVSSQTFTVTNVTLPTNGRIWFSPAVTPNTLCPPLYAWIDSTTQVKVFFVNLTAAGCTPSAGNYNFIVGE